MEQRLLSSAAELLKPACQASSAGRFQFRPSQQFQRPLTTAPRRAAGRSRRWVEGHRGRGKPSSWRQRHLRRRRRRQRQPLPVRQRCPAAAVQRWRHLWGLGTPSRARVKTRTGANRLQQPSWWHACCLHHWVFAEGLCVAAPRPCPLPRPAAGRRNTAAPALLLQPCLLSQASWRDTSRGLGSGAGELREGGERRHGAPRHQVPALAHSRYSSLVQSLPD